MTDTEVTAIESMSDLVVRTGVSQSYDWYSEGEARTVEIGGVQIVVRLVGRKGRRSRISITAPAGSVFRGA
jgi:hypothetical protein